MSGHESNDNFGFSFRSTVSPSLTWIVRGTESKVQTYTGSAFSIRHGGSEHEVMAVSRFAAWPKLEAGLGVSLPNTPERFNQAVLTYDLGWTESVLATTDVRLGLRGVLAPSPISVASLGATFRPGHSTLSLFGEIGFVVSGDNTRDLQSGESKRCAVGRFGVECAPGKGDLRYGVAVTNQTGVSTGMSLTPALGNRYGVVFSVGYRF